MSYLNQPYENNFQELCAAMPLFYLEVFEMREVLKAEGWLLDNLTAGIEQTIDDNFIATADSATIKLWEEALELSYDEDLTLEQRKAIIIACLCGYGHIGEPEIRQMIAQYTDADVEILFKHGNIHITIDSEIFGETTLLNTLLRRIPAHLKLHMTVQVIRSFRQTLNIGFGTATGAEITALPMSKDREAQSTIYVRNGAGLDAGIYAAPISKDRSALQTVGVAQGGFLTPDLNGNQPNAKTASKRNQRAVSGGFFQSHITSKLIE